MYAKAKPMRIVSTITRILLLAGVCGVASAQVNVSLSPAPKQTFFDQSGAACAGCSLYSYAGGTTTPTPTYTSSTGTSQNTNPIVLDIAGAANVWLATSSKYKLVLKDALGTTIWTVDNVSGSGGGGSVVPCATAYAIQFSSSDATALACDPAIKVNTSSHAIEVGGTISGPYFSLHNTSTIPASWTFDVTTPATALASLGTIPYTSLPAMTGNSVLMNAINGSGTPTAVPLPLGCTNGINYSSTTHTYTCITAGTTPLSNLATQSADTVVMNASGGPSSPSAVNMPSGCANGINYNTSTHSWSCVSSSTLTCTGSIPPWSCYSIDAQGVITEFGVVVAPTTSNTVQTVSISFPFTFPNQEVLTVSGGSQPDGANDSYVVYHTGLSSTGAVAVIRCSVNIGGAGCSSISNQIPVNWEAKGR